ncbi:MAG: flagellar basal body rod C-terminal domain-containing protein, partial [Oscillospiraceae bacterium]
VEDIGVFLFTNPEGLKPLGNTSFKETEVSGKAKAANSKKSGTTKLLQGVLESSSVNLADQMAEVITAQRAYSLNAKIIQTADQIEEIANNLR